MNMVVVYITAQTLDLSNFFFLNKSPFFQLWNWLYRSCFRGRKRNKYMLIILQPECRSLEGLIIHCYESNLTDNQAQNHVIKNHVWKFRFWRLSFNRIFKIKGWICRLSWILIVFFGIWMYEGVDRGYMCLK